MDFYVWGQAKAFVYGFNKPDTRDHVIATIRQAFASVNNNFENQHWQHAVRKISQLCVAYEGHHVEHLYIIACAIFNKSAKHSDILIQMKWLSTLKIIKLVFHGNSIFKYLQAARAHSG